MMHRTLCAWILAVSLGATILPTFAQETAKIELDGPIESLPDSGLTGEWMVGGRKVNVLKSTRLKEKGGDKFVVGQLVEVEGYMTGDVLDADKIETDD